MMMRVNDDQMFDGRNGYFALFYAGYGHAVMAGRKNPAQALLLRTGAALDGRDKRLLQWIDDSGIVSLISDNPAVEHLPPDIDPTSHDMLPLHEHCIFKLGIHLGEYFWLSELADWLRENNR